MIPAPDVTMTTGHTMHESDLFSEPAAMVEAALTKAIEAANLPAHLREQHPR